MVEIDMWPTEDAIERGLDRTQWRRGAPATTSPRAAVLNGTIKGVSVT